MEVADSRASMHLMSSCSHPIHMHNCTPHGHRSHSEHGTAPVEGERATWLQAALYAAGLEPTTHSQQGDVMTTHHLSVLAHTAVADA